MPTTSGLLGGWWPPKTFTHHPIRATAGWRSGCHRPPCGRPAVAPFCSGIFLARPAVFIHANDFQKIGRRRELLKILPMASLSLHGCRVCDCSIKQDPRQLRHPKIYIYIKRKGKVLVLFISKLWHDLMSTQLPSPLPEINVLLFLLYSHPPHPPPQIGAHQHEHATQSGSGFSQECTPQKGEGGGRKACCMDSSTLAFALGSICLSGLSWKTGSGWLRLLE